MIVVDTSALIANLFGKPGSAALVERLNLGVDRLRPVDEVQMRIALRARIEYGRGFGAPAGLNFGDSFAYALAKVLDAPLLFIGDHFTRTDVKAAL